MIKYTIDEGYEISITYDMVKMTWSKSVYQRINMCDNTAYKVMPPSICHVASFLAEKK